MIVNITTVGGTEATYEDVVEVMHLVDAVEIIHDRGTVKIPADRIELLETWEEEEVD